MPKIASSSASVKCPCRCETVYRVRNGPAYEAGLKQRMGRQLRARCKDNQETGARMGCAVLNRMLMIAKPVSYPIEKGA